MKTRTVVLSVIAVIALLSTTYAYRISHEKELVVQCAMTEIALLEQTRRLICPERHEAVVAWISLYEPSLADKLRAKNYYSNPLLRHRFRVDRPSSSFNPQLYRQIKLNRCDDPSYRFLAAGMAHDCRGR